MPEFRVLLVGQSPLLAETIGPALAGLWPDVNFHAIPKHEDAVAEMERGGVGAGLVCLLGPQDEAQAAEVMQAVQARHLSVPVFVIAPEPDDVQSFRLFELGPTWILPVPFSAVRSPVVARAEMTSRVAQYSPRSGCRM
jgi:hypothetical protein